MIITDEHLTSYLHRVFNKDPMPVLALRVTCDSGQMTWSVVQNILTLSPVGGAAQPLTLDLSQFSVLGLANFLAAQPGYIVPFQTDQAIGSLSALVLLNATGDVSQSNGDHLYAFTNILYAYLGCNATEINAAQAQIANALAQMSTTSAAGEFLDLLGSYYKVPRNPGELDPVYGPRIISNVLLPSANNVGMAIALQAQFPNTVAEVDDAVTNSGSLLIRDGSIHFNSLFVHNSNALAISSGLFDITFAFSFGGPVSVTAYPALLIAVMNSYRAGGTYLRNLILKNGTSASIIVNSFNIGPILVIVYDQNQTFEDSWANSWWFEPDEDTEEDMEVFKSVTLQTDAVPKAIEDVFDWSDETVDQDELIYEYISSAVGVNAIATLPGDSLDWMDEEPDEDEREAYINSAPVVVDGSAKLVDDATDWSEEEPDDELEAYNTSKVATGVAMAVQQGLMTEDYDHFSDDGDEFYANHFTNTDGAAIVSGDPWPWMDEDEEMILIVSGYLNSDAPPSTGAPIVTEGNIGLTTEAGVVITTE